MYKLSSNFKPSQEQEKAINSLTDGINKGLKKQVLLGVTGSGKTFTMANIIKNTGKKALVITHNKTLAAQLCNEFRSYFPNNRVEYFVSYYDYYQPEAYVPNKDLYIEKDLKINEEIERLRNSATAALCERDDVIVVASVSCIYGLGAPIDYFILSLSLRVGQKISREEIIRRLVELQYKRSDIEFVRTNFRVRGDYIEIYPSEYKDSCIRIELFDDTVERIVEFNSLTSKLINKLKHISIFPCSQYIVQRKKINNSINLIEKDLSERIFYFRERKKLIEAQRIDERVNHDLEMLREIGRCSGIENYLRYFDGRKPGDPPYTLQDFFKDDYITFIDESHMTIPQLNAMYNGDYARKKNLVDFGFRLPAAFDNRPLKFNEFNKKLDQVIFVSATPGNYEIEESENTVEQIIRPTGLLDPIVEVKSVKNQVQDSLVEIKKIIKLNGRILITTLTKKAAENLSKYLEDNNIKVNYMHSETKALDRVQIIENLRKGVIDVIVGVNLLREGLDIPEVMLVCVFDADKEGFLRGRTALIQIIGRAARNANSKVILYADMITNSMKQAIDETNRRREIQNKYNIENGIIPTTIVKKTKNTLEISNKVEEEIEKIDYKHINEEILRLTKIMIKSAEEYDFESAIKFRDMIAKLKKDKNEK